MAHEIFKLFPLESIIENAAAEITISEMENDNFFIADRHLCCNEKIGMNGAFFVGRIFTQNQQLLEIKSLRNEK